MNESLDRVLGALQSNGCRVTGSGVTRKAQCPAHDDNNPSLSVTAKDGKTLLNCHAGCKTDDIVNSLGLQIVDLFDEPADQRRGYTVEAEYSYVDESGTLLFTKERRYPKDFRCYREVNGHRVYKLEDVRRVLYRLPDLVDGLEAGKTIYICEGEKDADRLASLGYVATTNYDGAGKWRDDYNDYFAGADVVIVADNDEPGLAHAELVERQLADRAATVMVVRAAVGNDLSDHLNAGKDVNDLVPIGDPGSILANPHIVESRPWPVLHKDALQGYPGVVVRSILPYTEADPAAILLQLLAAAGAYIGGVPHVFAGDSEHPARVWPLIVGKTSSGAKGTGWASVRRIIKAASVTFTEHMVGGLSSGEGLIERVRDPHGDDPDAKDYDPGVTDKRLLVMESEFGSVLGRGKREGSTLSEIIRQGWDGGRLQTMTRKSPLVATDPHIVIVGHVTPGELKIKLSDAEVMGGTMNRFLVCMSKRSKKLPGGGGVPHQVVADLAVTLTGRREQYKDIGRVTRTPDAEKLWHDSYDELTPDLPDGRYASVTSRAVPTTLRLSLLYALLDNHQDDKVEIRVEHVKAALAVWRYASQSAAYLFGNTPANSDLARIEAAISAAGDEGLTRTQISVDLFQRHKSKDKLDEALAQVLASGRVRKVDIPTAGRSITKYLHSSELSESGEVSELSLGRELSPDHSSQQVA